MSVDSFMEEYKNAVDELAGVSTKVTGGLLVCDVCNETQQVDLPNCISVFPKCKECGSHMKLVGIYGHTPDLVKKMDVLQEIARKHNIALIAKQGEDGRVCHYL